MVSRSRWTLLMSFALVATAACSGKEKEDDMGSASATPAAAMAMDAAEYTLVFKSSWTAANHPFEYPSSNPVSGPHFSGIIGTSHNASFSLFKEGMTPTPGLEKLSEEGKHSPLDEEIRAAIAAGTAGAQFNTGPLRDFSDSIVTTLRVSKTHPLLSFVAMIAPSPDWFTGAADVNLMEGMQWAPSRTVSLYAWDSGGDDGLTYKASDKDNNPKKPTMQAMTRHFATGGAAVPVATVTITKKM